MTDASGSTQYGYDIRGNIITKTVIQGPVTQTLSYLYNGSDQLTGMIYPSGRTLTYHYDTAGRINQVLTADSQGVTQSLLDLIDYQPFGGMKSQVYGNSLSAAQSYDLDYRLDSQAVPAILERNYAFDDADNIQFITNPLDLNNDQDLTYDALSRLDSAQGVYGNAAYQYDKTGNRIQYSNGSTTDDYHYPIGSHKLDDINTTNIYSYDANGNTTQLPSASITTSLVYGDQNRLTQVNGATYTYNGTGERVKKVIASGTITHYYYDQNGQLIIETDALGQTQKEYLYVNGQLVAIAKSGQSNNGGGNQEIILDNQAASYSDSWPTSTSIPGYQGSNYQYHTGNISGTGPGLLGNPIDNAQTSFTDNWPTSTSVNQYYGNNYQYHAGSTAGLGILGSPVDNLQATYTGAWTTSTSVNQYYANNYQFHAAGTGSNTATWATGINASASYDVYVSWTAHANRASNAKFTVNHTGGSNTVTVNQQQNGNQWNLLGTFTLDANSTVSLSDDANGYVIADAISILPAGTPPTVTAQSGETATWALNINNTASYDVYANWAAHANRASDAKYTVHHSNGSDTVTVNQKQNGGQWNLLGTYTLDSNSTVGLSSLANGYVIADGITILPAGTPPIVTATQVETATWTPNRSGEYEIYANWTAHANRATDAKYTIQHSNGSDTLSVNQQQNGGQWNLLGTFTLDSSSTVIVSNDANGYVIADGIRLVSTSSTSQSGIYYVHNDHLGTPQVITDAQQAVVWQAFYDPFGKATITTETISNNIRFPGQYYDQETGLYYNYFRYYDPLTGRYITSDPIGLKGGLNTYAYALQNPLKYIDPDGRLVWLVIPGVCAGGGCEALGIGLAWAATTIDWPDGLDKPIDPWNDTNTEVEVPTNILPPEIPDQCEVAYKQEIESCNSSCSGLASKAACIAKAKFKLWICKGAKKPKWPDDFNSNGGNGDGPGYSGF